MFLFDVAISFRTQFYTPCNYLTNFRLLKLTSIKKIKTCAMVSALVLKFLKACQSKRIDG